MDKQRAEEVYLLLGVLERAKVVESVNLRTEVIDGEIKQVPLEQPVSVESTVLTMSDIGLIRSKIMERVQEI